MTEVVAVFIWENNKFTICKYPADEEALVKILERYGNPL